MATQSKKVKEEKGPHPYDFSLKRSTKPEIAALTVKPLQPTKMAEAMAKTHGIQYAKRIVEPLTVSSFKDKDGNPVVPNTSSKYWTAVFQALNKVG